MVIEETRQLSLNILLAEPNLDEQYLLIDWNYDTKSEYNFPKMYKEFEEKKKQINAEYEEYKHYDIPD